MNDDDSSEWVEAGVEDIPSSKKNKKQRKEDRKKEKKDKKDKKRHNNDSDSDNDNTTTRSKKKLKDDNDDSTQQKQSTTITSSRDEWMSLESSAWISGSKSHNDVKRELLDKQKKDKQDLADALAKTAGVVDPKLLAQGILSQPKPATETASSSSSSIPLVGDGGAAWKQRKLMRAVQQAKEEGVPLEKILRERYDESEIPSLLQQAKTIGSAPPHPNPQSFVKTAPHQQQGRSSSHSFGTERDYLKKEQDDHHNFKMKRPSENSELNWRNRGDRSQSQSASSPSSSYKEKYNQRQSDQGERDRSYNDRDRRDDRENKVRDYNDRDRGDNDRYRRDDRDRRDDYRREDRDNDRDRRYNERDRRDDRDRSYNDRNRDRYDKGYRDDDRGDKRGENDRRDDRYNDRKDEKVPKEDKVIPPTISVVRTEQPNLSDFFPNYQKTTTTNETKKEPSTTSPSLTSTTTTATSSTTSTSSSTDNSGVNINKLSAEMMKAKIMGNTKRYEELKKQVDELKAKKDTPTPPVPLPPQDNPKEETTASDKVKLSGLDEYGRKIFMNEQPSSKTMGTKNAFDKKGERQQYYSDDNNLSLDELVARERKGLGENMDLDFLKTMAKSGNWATDDREDFGPEMTKSKQPSKRQQQKMDDKEMTKYKQKLINADKKVNSALERCWHCYQSPQFQKHMMISTGNNVFLSLPTRSQLISGHCQIVPIQHIVSCRATDEEVWDEIQNFKKCLIQMFAKEKKFVVFMETAMRFKSQYHTLIDCIPMKQDDFMKAPGFFKKALMESESEWTPNKLIDCIKKGGLKNSIPEKGFPYFWVEFGYKQTGYVHPIDDEAKFPRDFGKSVITSILELDLDEVYNRRRSRSDEDTMVSNFKSKWNDFDWTKSLDNE